MIGIVGYDKVYFGTCISVSEEHASSIFKVSTLNLEAEELSERW
jgi:hypothetical protein